MRKNTNLVRFAFAACAVGLGTVGACERNDRFEDRSGVRTSTAPRTESYGTRNIDRPVSTQFPEGARGGGPAVLQSELALTQIASARCEASMTQSPVFPALWMTLPRCFRQRCRRDAGGLSMPPCCVNGCLPRQDAGACRWHRVMSAMASRSG